MNVTSAYHFVIHRRGSEDFKRLLSDLDLDHNGEIQCDCGEWVDTDTVAALEHETVRNYSHAKCAACIALMEDE